VLLALAGAGDRAAALAAYARCRQLLRDQLAVEPDEATRALYEQIRTNPLQVADSRLQIDEKPNLQSTIYDLQSRGWSEAPEPGRVYGRAPELDRLRHWLLDERCQFVALLGIGGVGKTTLAAMLAQAVAGQFTHVIWRSLLNAPPLEELLRPIVQSLAGVPLPASLDEQLALLLDQLRRQRVLLVLDNMESILHSDGLGQMRAGYESYALLLDQLVRRRHASCVLLTSRGRPRGLERWEAELVGVRTLRLDGLDPAAGQAMLHARGLTGQAEETRTLVARYSGHPLALQLVAQTVRELFGGAIGAFLGADALIFDDIRAVLDQQFAHLSPLEQEILFWLAIEREPISAATLQNNLVQPETSRAFLEALRALQHRSLLETMGDGFTLQNVLIEYMTERLIEGVCDELLSEDKETRRAGDKENLTHQVSRSPALLPTRSLLNRFALLKAQAREYVRQSQVRLMLQPIAEQLVAKLGKARLAVRARSMLDALRATAPLAPGYAAGNLLNLLLYLKIDVSGYDFSRLSVWQADLRGVTVSNVNFGEADLSGCAFTLTFSTFAIMVGRSEHILIAAPVHGDICLWRAANGQLHDAFRTPSKGAAPVIFSSNGQFLAGCCLDYTVRLWSVETGATLHIFEGHTALAHALAFSHDARLLASRSLDNTIRVWDVSSGRCLRIVSHRTPGYTPLAFRPAPPEASRPDAILLASGGGDQTIYLWDIEHGQIVDTLRGHMREIESLAFSPDGMLLASGSHDGTILLWDVSVPGRSQLLGTLQGHSHVIRALVFHPNSTVLASGSADGSIRLWDRSGGQARQILLGHTGEVTLLAFNADGQVLASGSADRVIRLWDAQTGRAIDSLNGYIDAVHAVRFHPDGRQLASGSADGMIRLWDNGHGRLERSFQAHAGQVLTVAFSPDGRLLASGGADGTIQIWHAVSGQSLRTLRGHTGAVKSLAFHPDGQLLASGGADRTIRFWFVTESAAFGAGSGARILYGHTDDVTAVAFSPDGRMLASSSFDHTAQLWAVDRGEQIRSFKGHTAALTATTFSPDGKRIASIGYDNTVRVWEVATGQSSAGWEGISAGGRVVAFSPHGELLAHGVEEVGLVIRDTSTGNIIHTLRGHTSTIIGLHWSPTAPILASSGWDGTICVWDVATGVCLHTLRASGPYAGLNIASVTGISEAQKTALRVLGAVEQETPIRTTEERA
jgi:WD40 repeat protein